MIYIFETPLGPEHFETLRKAFGAMHGLVIWFAAEILYFSFFILSNTAVQNWSARGGGATPKSPTLLLPKNVCKGWWGTPLIRNFLRIKLSGVLLVLFGRLLSHFILSDQKTPFLALFENFFGVKGGDQNRKVIFDRLDVRLNICFAIAMSLWRQPQNTSAWQR